MLGADPAALRFQFQQKFTLHFSVYTSRRRKPDVALLWVGETFFILKKMNNL